MTLPCCCHVFSPRLGTLNLVFGISGLLNMFLLHDSWNCYLLGKGAYVFDSHGLSVCLLVCGQHYSISY